MKNLLVPIDFSDVSDRLVATAEKQATAFGAKVWLLHCISEYPALSAMGEIPVFLPSSSLALPGRYPDEYRQLAKLTSNLRDNGIDAELLFVSGLPTEQILSAADDHQADLIIMGSHGHGMLYEVVVGTVTEAVLHRTEHPTLVVPSVAIKEPKPAHTYLREAPLATPY